VIIPSPYSRLDALICACTSQRAMLGSARSSHQVKAMAPSRRCLPRGPSSGVRCSIPPSPSGQLPQWSRAVLRGAPTSRHEDAHQAVRV
jgi:hypothetical protein